MAWISAVFFCLGAADTLLGDRLGLGSAFRQGFAAVVDLLLLMTGFMALAPWLGTHLAPVITPVALLPWAVTLPCSPRCF